MEFYRFIFLIFRGVHREEVSPGWSAIFPGSDRTIALGTQYFLFERNKQRPAQVQTYITFK